jgi:hypothetical protein
MKFLYRLRAYLASRQARRIRRDALHDYRLAMRRAEKLERQSLRFTRLCGPVLLSGKPEIPQAKPEPDRLPRLPESRQHFTNHQLVER